MTTIPEETSIALCHGSRNPIPIPDPNRPFTTEELHRIKLHEIYQRTVLRGFTIQELELCGAWTKNDAIPSDLKTPIHPEYERKVWFAGTEVIEGGISGTWDVTKNEELWIALKPSLRLATLMITQAGLLPWLDALIVNKWQVVPASDLQDGCPPESGSCNAYSIHTRSPGLVSKSAESIRSTIDQLQGRLSIRISPSLNSGRRGFVWTVHRRQFLQDDPTVDIAHETIHALGACSASLKSIPFDSAEPFFEADAMTELGRSWEKFMFGGMIAPLRNEPDLKQPYLALGTATWPNWLEYGAGRFTPGVGTRYRPTDEFEPGNARDGYDLFPIPISFFSKHSTTLFLEVRCTGTGARRSQTSTDTRE
ncbi:hypothetical protein N431DRAFT_458734 [Stipitochalara longipes BDJ]|nr:hypothetical protein N431DRAFT_458734 [Stipitochalara longipes BDJ]